MGAHRVGRAGAAGLVLLLWMPRAVLAQESGAPRADEVGELRQELEALRRDYQARVATIEQRLAALEDGARPVSEPPVGSGSGSTQAPAASAGDASAAVAAAPTPTASVPATSDSGAGSLPVYGGASASSKVFNPDIAAVGNFVGAMGDTPGGGEPSLEMSEAELSFQAVVDPYARADFFVTIGPDEVALEEGYITFPTLPGGLLAKVGQMRDAFGKVDALHPHVMPWIDRPLMQKNLLGGEDALADAGLSVSRLIPNPWLFLEATGQVYQGNSTVFEAPTRGDLAYVGHLRGYRDLSESTNLDLGGSIAYGHNGITDSTTTRLLGADLTFRYRPLRRSIYTSVFLRGEATWSRREEASTAVDAFGAYGSLEYQFARRFSGGLRLDYAERADQAGLRDKGGSLFLTFRPSEFSLLRAQLRRTTFGEGSSANEFLFQFLYAIGAHGAHPF